MRYLLMIGLPVVLIVALIGCSPKAAAKRHLKPVVKEIESFKAKQGRIPNSLEELQATNFINLKLLEKSDVGLIWSIQYEKKSDQSYVVSFNHVHYDLYFTDGKESGWNFNPFR